MVRYPDCQVKSWDSTDARERAGISIKAAGARESKGVELVFSSYKAVLVSGKKTDARD
jgi:hypothetical protein